MINIYWLPAELCHNYDDQLGGAGHQQDPAAFASPIQNIFIKRAERK